MDVAGVVHGVLPLEQLLSVTDQLERKEGRREGGREGGREGRSIATMDTHTLNLP